MPYYPPASSGGGISGPGITAVGNIVTWGNTAGTAVVDFGFPPVNWSIDTQSFNGVQRLRASTANFLANADFENWNNGTSVAPPGWVTAGGVTISQQTAISIGAFSAQLVFDATNTGVFYQAVPSNINVDYTFTLYCIRTAGTGTANLVARRDDSPNTVFATCALPVTGVLAPAMLTVKPAAGTALRFSIEASSASTSTWQLDECMFQESKAVATAFVRANIDDSTSQFVFGQKTWGGGSYTFSSGLKMYDTGSTNLMTFAASGNPGSATTITIPTVTSTLKAIVTSTTSAPGATPAVAVKGNTATYIDFTALGAAITSMTTNLTGTPARGDTLWLSFTDGGTARAITWGTGYEASTVALPTTTVISTRLDVGFIWNTVTSKWRCIAVA